MINIILLSGKQGSGKTSIADALASKLREAHPDAKVMRTRFSSILYEMHDAVRDIGLKYGIPMEKKDRFLLQWLGTEFGRNTKGEDVWVDALKNKVLSECPDFVIIDDVRFVNEFFTFNDTKGVIEFKVRLECDQSIRAERVGAAFSGLDHPSECGLDHLASLSAFDLDLDTHRHSLDHCVSCILLELDFM